VKISVGILIVGSLYWDKDTSRENWRRDRLSLDEKFHVPAPIRYGRQSEKRGFSYTMVFSEALCREEHQLGRAIAVRCSRYVSSIDDLVEEAESLWATERNSYTTNGKRSASWGCVALMANPSSAIPTVLRDDWARHVASEHLYGRFCLAAGENAIVSPEGMLQIPWPTLDDVRSLNLDILLATATNPTIKKDRYPTAEEIADAWKTVSGKRYLEYFRSNRNHGIATFQDGDIEWHLGSDLYA